MEITNISNIDSTQFQNQNYTSKDEALLNSLSVSKEFGLPEDNVELHVISPNGELLDIVYDFKNYTTLKTNEGTSLYSQVIVDPKSDLESFGLNQGTYDVVYNFYRTMFSSSEANQFYITEISSDRTEIKVSTNNASYTSLGQSYLTFIAERNSRAFYSDFILNFGNNKTFIGVNVAFDNVNQTSPSLYIKLYEPLPTTVTLKDTFWLVENISDPYAFQVTTDFIAEATTDSSPLRGPNINIELAEKANLTTPYLNLSTLLSSDISSSYQQLQSWLEEKSIEISVDYSDFSNFIHFSSATERIENFQYKLTQIQSLQADINSINGLNISSSVTYTSASVITLQNQLNTLIQKLDGYEYYLYYESGSNTWPKSNTTKPYSNYSVTSPTAITWFNNQVQSASIYDTNNRDYIWNNLPEYITVDQQNSNLELFVSMLGQHYDYIWTYIKDITDLQVADNRLEHGISKDLVADTLRNFGIKLYTNSRGQDDFYISLLGINPDNSTLPSTGSYVIDNYVSASQYTIPGNDIVKETYKRVYHNLPYLLKTKGTRRGLRALINCFGISDTILKIKEYGGNKKDQDIIEQITPKFNYGLNLHNSDTITVESYPSYKQYLDTGFDDVRSDTLEFRFKLDSSNILPTQTILGTSNDYKSITVTQTTGSKANINFGLSDSTTYIYSNPIELPLYNDDWWTLNLTRETGSLNLFPSLSIYDLIDDFQAQIIADGGTIESTPTLLNILNTLISPDLNLNQTYTLTIGNKDANGIQYLTSCSIYNTGSNKADYNKYGWDNDDGITLGSQGGGALYYGIFQEFRMWIGSIPINDFKDHILNPRSIVFNGTSGSYDNLIFRLPLGSELDNFNSPSNGFITSVHPSPTSSFWTGTNAISYANNAGGLDNSTLDINHETYLINTPNIGSFTEIDEKVRIATPNLVPGDVLTPYISIQKPEEYPYSTDLNVVEVAISPQDSINADIIEQLGSFSIDDYIGDPRLASSNSYPSLTDLRNFYFKKYSKKENVFDLIKLLSYFDNSLFKMIKDFVPAKTNLSTGLVINTNILERNKIARHEPVMTFVDYSGSIETAFISGSNGLNKVYNTSYTSSIPNISGSIQKINTQNKELFTGELGGTVLIAHSQSQDNIVYELNHIATTTTQALHDNFYRLPINPTLNNVMDARTSPNYLTIDYSANPILPVNLNYLTASLIANLNTNAFPFLRATVQDSNYTLKRHINPRYNGSKLFSSQYNVYNNGDKSFGNSPVIDYNSVKFAYFKEITSQSLTFPGRVNANIKYLIDSASNVIELTEANKNLFDVQSTFNRVDANISLDNVNQPSKQKQLNGLKPIYAGGFKYYPILQNINPTSGSISFNLSTPMQINNPSGSGSSAPVPLIGGLQIQNYSLTNPIISPPLNTAQTTLSATLDSTITVSVKKTANFLGDIYQKVSGSITFEFLISSGNPSGAFPKFYDFNNQLMFAPTTLGLFGLNYGGEFVNDWMQRSEVPAGFTVNAWNFGGPSLQTTGPGTGSGGVYNTSQYGVDNVSIDAIGSSASLATSNITNQFNPLGVVKTFLVGSTPNPIDNSISYNSTTFTSPTLPLTGINGNNTLGCKVTYYIEAMIKVPQTVGYLETYTTTLLNLNNLEASIKGILQFTSIINNKISVTTPPKINYPIFSNTPFYNGTPPAYNYNYVIVDNGFVSGSGGANHYFERGLYGYDSDYNITGSDYYYLTASYDLSTFYYNNIINPINNTLNPFIQIETTSSQASFVNYENIENKFLPKPGDLIRFYDHDRNIFPIEFEREIIKILPPVNTPSGSDNRLVFKLSGTINNQSCVDYIKSIQNFIFMSKVEDETNVILFTDKNLGQTSAGILLPEYLDKQTKDDAGNIVKRLKSQNLLDVGQTTYTISDINGGGF